VPQPPIMWHYLSNRIAKENTMPIPMNNVDRIHNKLLQQIADIASTVPTVSINVAVLQTALANLDSPQAIEAFVSIIPDHAFPDSFPKQKIVALAINKWESFYSTHVNEMESKYKYNKGDTHP